MRKNQKYPGRTGRGGGMSWPPKSVEENHLWIESLGVTILAVWKVWRNALFEGRRGRLMDP